MDNQEIKYNGEFTIEQRKAMTAQMLKELRKAKKLSQKEVAAQVNIPAPTYNTYESGRTEPPIEILVRLSYLYELPIDIIVQRDRTYQTADDLERQMVEYGKQLEEFQRRINEGGNDATDVSGLIEVIGKLVDALTSYSQTETAQKALDIPESD